MSGELATLLILAVAIGIVFTLIIRLKVHAFIALIVSAAAVGVLSPQIPFAEVMPQVAQSFGAACTSIGIVIALAAVIGQCMMESGAADKVVRVLLRALGVEQASISLATAGGVLAIPVFFDTVFYLLVPIARALRVRTGKNYVLYIMATAAGAALTHSLVPPTPGPLAMAANLHIDLGTMILAGLAVSIPATAAGWLFSVYTDRRLDVPFREAPGLSMAGLEAMSGAAEGTLPPFAAAMMPIVLPVLLITSNTIAAAFAPDGSFARATAFLGNPNFALLVSAAVSLWLVKKHKHTTLTGLAQTVEIALASGGAIILITAAGGSFGALLRAAGVGDTLSGVAAQFSVPVLLLSYLLAALFKVAQGSSTVSMITVSAIMAGTGAQFGFHPVYIALAIGGGSLVGSWMNDSGFWVFTKMSGLTEAEGLRTWSPLLAVIGTAAFLFTCLGAVLLPMR